MVRGRIEFAKQLRTQATDAERRLWSLARPRFHGLKFRRQHPVGNDVVDFLCAELKLVVELDGGHPADQVNADAMRQRVLEQAGFIVACYWNHDVMHRLDEALADLQARVIALTPLPSPLPAGGERE